MFDEKKKINFIFKMGGEKSAGSGAGTPREIDTMNDWIHRQHLGHTGKEHSGTIRADIHGG